MKVRMILLLGDGFKGLEIAIFFRFKQGLNAVEGLAAVEEGFLVIHRVFPKPNENTTTP